MRWTPKQKEKLLLSIKNDNERELVKEKHGISECEMKSMEYHYYVLGRNGFKRDNVRVK